MLTKYLMNGYINESGNELNYCFYITGIFFCSTKISLGLGKMLLPSHFFKEMVSEKVFDSGKTERKNNLAFESYTKILIFINNIKIFPVACFILD